MLNVCLINWKAQSRMHPVRGKGRSHLSESRPYSMTSLLPDTADTGHTKKSNVSTVPEKPNLEYLTSERTAPPGFLRKACGCATCPRPEDRLPHMGETEAHVERFPFSRAGPGSRTLSAMSCVFTFLEHPELRATLDQPLPDYGFGLHALYAAVQRSDRATIDVLLRAGADINQRTHWWAGSFGILDDCDPGMLDFLLERGALLDAHSASRLGLLPKLRELLAADPSLVHARGGDGQTPLHFASTVEVAEFLLANGADIDARDIDHESTPAQYMLRVEQKRHYPRDRQDVARYLVARGCQTDLLMAAALGDADLVKRHLDADPACIRMSVSREWFPMQQPPLRRPDLYLEIGGNRTAHAVARDFGHEEIFELLLERTPEDLKLALACELGDETTFHQFLSKHPENPLRSGSAETPQRRPEQQHQSGSTHAGGRWPVDTPGEMGATALHWAGFNGNAEMARGILRFHPNLEVKSKEHQGTPLGWAIYGSGNGWRRETGDYVGTVSRPG